MHFNLGTQETKKLIVVVNYTQPNESPTSDQSLKIILNSITQKHRNEALLVGGDFNRNLERMKLLMNPYNLTVTRPHQEHWYTR